MFLDGILIIQSTLWVYVKHSDLTFLYLSLNRETRLWRVFAAAKYGFSFALKSWVVVLTSKEST